LEEHKYSVYISKVTVGLLYVVFIWCCIECQCRPASVCLSNAWIV